MADMPITLTEDQILPILQGTQWQFRRLEGLPCHIGDRLWVRERWVYHFGTLMHRAGLPKDGFHYDASGWRPPSKMPKKAARIWLTVIEVRVEHLHKAQPADMRAEGLRPDYEASLLWRETLARNYRRHWDATHDRGAQWNDNPLTCVIRFEAQLVEMVQIMTEDEEE